jgi:hypothetical protein
MNGFAPKHAQASRVISSATISRERIRFIFHKGHINVR